MYGATTSSAAARTAGRSMPVATPRRSKTAASTSVGALPAPAPSPRVQPSICRAPASYATTEFATPIDRFWCPWNPTCASLPSFGNQRVHTVAHIVKDHCAGRVDDVRALTARVDHDPGVGCQSLRARHVREHQKADRLQPEIARGCEVLDRDVRLGAMGRDSRHPCADSGRPPQVLDGADARNEKDGNPRVRSLVDRCGDQLELGDERIAVVESRAAQAIAVGDLEHLDVGVVERAHGRAHLLDSEAVRHGVAAVAQRRVGDPHVAAHASAPSRDSARRSPTLAAAAVITSRLPACGGRKSPAP